MRSQSSDRIFSDIRRQLAAGRPETKHSDLLVWISDPLWNIPVEDPQPALLLSSPRCQKRFREEHLENRGKT